MGRHGFNPLNPTEWEEYSFLSALSRKLWTDAEWNSRPITTPHNGSANGTDCNFTSGEFNAK